MSQATPQTTDLLADLIAEFKPEKKVKATPPAKTAENTKKLTTPHAKELYLASSPSWVPQSVIHHVLIQHCLCCGYDTEVLGSTLVRHYNPRLLAHWEIQRSTLTNLDHLPREFVRHNETVEACPSCLRAEEILCDFPPVYPHQIPLFH